MFRYARWPLVLLLCGSAWLAAPAGRANAQMVTSENVRNAIRGGVHFLKDHQSRDGSWPGQPGTTALATLALLTAGEKADSPAVSLGLNQLRQTEANALNNTYAVALQAMAFAAADPKKYELDIAQCVSWLERTQIRPGAFPGRGFRRAISAGTGSWSYSLNQGPVGDNSNSQYALLGLHAGSEAGIPVDREVWALARRYWEECQQNDGGWNYKPARGQSTGSMSCAG